MNNFIKEHRGFWSALKEYLGRVRGVKVGDFSVAFSWGTQKPLSLTGLFDTLNRFAGDRGIKVVVAVDEAQQLKKVVNFDFSKLLAHIYDYDGNLQLLLTGSQVGLLNDILGVNDPSSPLYGRARSEIQLGRFSVEQSTEFLREGFKQCGMKVSDETIEYAVEKLDGIVGWLSNFGWQCYLRGKASKNLVDELMKEAAGLARREFENFLKKRSASERYRAIMKRVAREPARWSEIRAYLEGEIETKIYDANLANLLGELLRAGFLEVKDGVYEVADPVLRYALRK
jgi:AAA+ ATPase superfamily predicted ATPase